SADRSPGWMVGPARRADRRAVGRARGRAVLELEEGLLALGVERVAPDGQPEPGPRLRVAADGSAGHAELVGQLGVVLPFGRRRAGDEGPEGIVAARRLEIRSG